MGFDLGRLNRRSLLVSLGCAMVISCARPGVGREPAADNFWTLFRGAFVDASGRVVDTGNGNISHSEGQGYGLLLAVLAGDRATFEKMLSWTEGNLARPDVALFTWKYDPRLPDPVADPNDATDGDILIAWALAEAAKRWGGHGWAARSEAIRSAIHQHLVIMRHGRHLLLPGRIGFAQGDTVTLNPSYFIWPALDLFAALDGEATWSAVISDAQSVLREAKFGAWGLPCDWIQIGADSKVVPSLAHPPRFGYDAIRIPLYAIAGRRASLAQPEAEFWRSAGGAGGHPPAWIDVTTGERADYPLSAGGMAILRRTLGLPPGPEALDTNYFSAALQALVRAL
jgi:endoglucanase